MGYKTFNYRCPKCGDDFRLTQEDLQTALLNGQCGNCQHEQDARHERSDAAGRLKNQTADDRASK